MKRSEINRAIKAMEELAAAHRFALPPFCSYKPEVWGGLGSDCNEIRDNMLGWDVTDYGGGDFGALGLTLITLRNGGVNDKYAKTYAEKLMMSLSGQLSPMHFHFKKTEDIINRGGGTLAMRLYNSDEGGGLADTDVDVSRDGRRIRLPAGGVLLLLPGESVTLTPGMYHEFWAEGGAAVLIGEVSQTNDDNTDNHFFEPLARFCPIDEDEPPYRLLCNELPGTV